MDELTYLQITTGTETYQVPPIVILLFLIGAIFVLALLITSAIQLDDSDDDERYQLISHHPSHIDISRIDRASARAKQRMRARSRAYLRDVHNTLRREP